MTIETIRMIAEIAGYITCIAAALTIVFGAAFNFKHIINAFKCLLRSSMLHIYYDNVEKREIRPYELQNFELSYKAYKALHGNSFIDDIRSVVITWKVVS